MATHPSLLYIDSCCFLPWLTAETGSVRAEAFFGNPPAKAEFAVSHWTVTEFHSAIAQKLRAGHLHAEQQSSVLARFQQTIDSEFSCWPVQARDFTEAALFMSSWRLGLRAGDALHLAIAKHQKATLVTLDTVLLDAARHYRIPTLTF